MMSDTSRQLAPPTHQRRLTTVLCADVVSYSRLMGENEVATYDSLRRLRQSLEPLVASHSGRIVSTAGDGLLAEFQSVVNGLSCAVHMQRIASELNVELPTERQLKLRIGVNLGDVIVADDGDLYGDGVNIAARLEALAPPGGICLSQNVYDQVRTKVDLEYRSLGRVRVKNIREPLQVYSVGSAPSPRLAVLSVRRRLSIAIAFSVLLAIVGVGVWIVERPMITPRQTTAQVSASPSRLDARTGVAVLPFRNQSGSSAEDGFADALGEAVGNGLGRFSTLFVVTGTATAPYKNADLIPEGIGRTLGVRYLIDGSVRRISDRLRVMVKLTEADSSRQLWSESYDVDANDPLSMLDNVSHRAVGTSAATLARAEYDRVLRKPIGELAPYEYLLRARADYMAHTREQNDEARALAERATELDPNDAQAYAALGWTYYMAVVSGWSEFPGNDISRAESLAQKAAGIDPEVTIAYELLANLFLLRSQFDRALAQTERALAVNPNDAANPAIKGIILSYAGQAAEAIYWSEEALRLDPNDAPASLHLGVAKYLLGEYDVAIAAIDRALARDPGRVNQVTARAILASSYAKGGRALEAERELQLTLRLQPFFSAAHFAAQFGTKEAQDAVLAGLREAGFH